VADSTRDTLASQWSLFPELSGVSEADLLEYYGPAAFSLLDALQVQVTLETLRESIASAPPLSLIHKDD
jgi:hypothetical protein